MEKGVNREGKKNPKKEDKKGIPISWFVLTIILAVILSFIVSMVVINLYAPAKTISMDAGKIFVQIQPDSQKSSGQIVVEVTDGKEVSK